MHCAIDTDVEAPEYARIRPYAGARRPAESQKMRKERVGVE